MSNLFSSVKVTELPPTRLVLLFVRIYLSTFPFDVWDKLLVLCYSVSEVSLLIQVDRGPSFYKIYFISRFKITFTKGRAA